MSRLPHFLAFSPPKKPRFTLLQKSSTLVRNVTARLYVQDAQGQVHVVDQTYNGLPITAHATPDPYNINHTVNFLPKVAWLQDNVTFWAEVDPANQVAESNESNNTGGNVTKSFQTAKTLRIAYVPIYYDKWRGLLCLDKRPDIGSIMLAPHFAMRAFPIRSIRTPIKIERWPELTWSLELTNGCEGSPNWHNAKQLLLTLEAKWLQLGGSNPPDYVFGWLPTNSFNRGLALPSWLCSGCPIYGVAAFSDDFGKEPENLELTGLTFAHELGHLMGHRGIKTNDCPSDDPGTGWPYADAKIQEHGLDRFTVKDPTKTYDYMSYCGAPSPENPDGSVWTSPWTYNLLYSQTLQLQTTGAPQKWQSFSTPQLYFIAGGLVYTNTTATLDPIWVITTTTPPPNPPAGTQYCLEAQNTSGMPVTSRCFDLSFVNYATGEPTNVDGFNLMLPYSSDVARIVFKKESEVLAVRPVSANAPVVTVLSPNGGETWDASGTYTVTWTASDADGDTLTYSVLYSSDGNNWMPVGATITETQLVVNAAELPGGITARIRVLVSDGVNTSTDESDNPFTVGRKGPEVFILSPERDITITAGTPVWLQGYAYDLEDGTLDDASLRWSSSHDGDLGAGAHVLASLSLGQHTLTFTATDSDGNTASASVQIDVIPVADLSIAKKDDPDPVIAGQNLTYTLAITNTGPYTATGVIVSDTLPADVTFGSATPSQGTCSELAGTVTCELGTINNGDSITVTVFVVPNAAGTITNTAGVTSNEIDPDSSNNTVIESTTITPTPTACYDFNNSNDVDIGDIALIAGAWRATDAGSLADYDFNDNNMVDVSDIMTVAAHLGQPCS